MFGAQVMTDSPSWLNLFTGLSGGSISFNPSGLVGQSFVNPMAGGGTVGSSPVNLWTN